MERYRISGVPITDDDGVLVGILTNRDLRFETDTSQPVSALMTSQEPRHRARRDDARGGRGDPPPQQDREASRRRPGRAAQGPHHRQGHLEEDQVPGRHERRAGAPARRRGGRGRDGCARASGGARRGRGRRPRGGHGPRPLARRPRGRSADQGGARHRARRGEHLDRRGCSRARRRRSGRRQVWARVPGPSAPPESSPGSASRR